MRVWDVGEEEEGMRVYRGLGLGNMGDMGDIGDRAVEARYSIWGLLW
jgi:hypothetical protein